MVSTRFISLVIGLTAALPSAVVGADEAQESAGLRLFRERIEPVLKAQCYECHSGTAKELQGGLRLDSPSAARRGGDTGAAVVPGKPVESLLIKAIKHQDN